MNTYRWQFREPDAAVVKSLADGGTISPLVARLLALRGVTDVEQAGHFLNPSLGQLLSPFLLAGMAEACERLMKAIEKREKIVIWGDYDVDGVTSSAILLSFLREIGIEAHSFIPDRFVHGYGLHEGALLELAGRGARVVIAVDCGITAVRQVEAAREAGLDVIVVDHHEPSEQLPAASAIVNPLRADCTYPFKKMAACGLSFHLLVALRARLRDAGWFGAGVREPDLRRYLDLTAIGTVADVVPLVGINRILTAAGLKAIAKTSRAGVKALAEVSGVALADVRASTIGFQLGPRINAAGRLSHARKGLDLLMAESGAEALAMAREIDDENRQRRAVQDTMVADAREKVLALGDWRARRSLVLWSADWHPGVAGIVASKVAEEFHRPCVVVAVDGDVGKGSARSIASFHLVQALQSCSEYLDGYGGHAHAAGVTLRAAHCEAFAAQLEAVARDRLAEEALIPTLSLDGEVQLDEVDDAFVGDVERMAPFGMGNPRPVLCSKNVRVHSVRPVGNGHLQLTFGQGQALRRAIAFGMADRAPEVGADLDVAFHPEHNVFRGERSIQLRVRDFRGAE